MIKVDDGFYEFLGLQRFSDIEKVKIAYKQKAKLYHPDLGGDIEKMKRLNYIYDILMKHKQEYDDMLKPKEVKIQFVYSWYSGSTSATATNSATTGW